MLLAKIYLDSGPLKDPPEGKIVVFNKMSKKKGRKGEREKERKGEIRTKGHNIEKTFDIHL